MVEIFGKKYYIDLDAISEKCKTGKIVRDEDKNEVYEINIFKYEIIKMCVDRVLSDVEDKDETLGLSSSNGDVSFKIAFNTLIKNNILLEDDE